MPDVVVLDLHLPGAGGEQVLHYIREEDMARRLAERTGFPREQIWVRETGPALSAHAGRGVIGVLAVPEG